MKQNLIISIFFIFLILVSIVNIAEARTLTGVKIDYAQYGVTLGERGIGNMLYNYTYDDGVYILKAKLGTQLFPKLNLYGDGSPADIKLTTHRSGATWSGKYQYIFMYCDSELYYQHGTITRSSYGCGDQIVRVDLFTEDQYTIFQNNLVQRLMTINFQPDVDRIFVNEVQWIPVQKGIVSITSVPSGATISDSNGVLGITPITISQIEGTYTFTASMSGYNSETKSVLFTDGIYGGVGSSNSLSYTLVVIPTGTPTPTSTPIIPQYCPTYVAPPTSCPAGSTLIVPTYDPKLGCIPPRYCTPTTTCDSIDCMIKLLPGFELIFAILGISAIYVMRKK